MKKHKDYIPAFDYKNRTPEDIIREGIHSETLRSNPAFDLAIRDLYWQYTQAEDGCTQQNAGDAGKHRYHYSLMRSLLTDLVSAIDGKIQEAENAKYDKELYGSEEK